MKRISIGNKMIMLERGQLVTMLRATA